jgi:hypothetical protein
MAEKQFIGKGIIGQSEKVVDYTKALSISTL